LRVDKNDLLLYAVTDRQWLGNASLAKQLEEAIQAGVTVVQLREKELDFDAFVALGKELQAVAKRHNIPFIINDAVDVALALEADGVHVGQSDMQAGDVRSRIGEGKILGVSAHSVEEALAAERNGADYLGVGAIYGTATKLDVDALSIETLQQICRAVSIPVVGIGGISEGNILELKGSGIDGIAVVSAIFAQPDITAAVKRLRPLAEAMVQP
jgi:thiamine-phosphate pyrophosphorylase